MGDMGRQMHIVKKGHLDGDIRHTRESKLGITEIADKPSITRKTECKGQPEAS